MAENKQTYKVVFHYRESSPETAGKIFAIPYEVPAPSVIVAVAKARAEFESYRNYNYASWIRVIIEDRTEVYIALGKGFSDERDIPGMITYLEGEKDPVRLGAVLATLQYSPRFAASVEFRDRVKGLLETPDGTLRVAVIMSLRGLGWAEILNEVSRLVTAEGDPKIRATMVQLLGDSRDKGMILPLLPILTDTDDRVRANAVEALENLCLGKTSVPGSEDSPDGKAVVLERLTPMVADGNNRVRANVIRAIYRLADFDNLENIKGMLSSRNPLMRASALYVLGEMKKPGYQPLIRENLGDEADIVRRNGLLALLKYDDPDTIGPILDHLPLADGELADLCAQFLFRHEDVALPELLRLRKQARDPQVPNHFVERFRNQFLTDGEFLKWIQLTVRTYL